MSGTSRPSFQDMIEPKPVTAVGQRIEKPAFLVNLVDADFADQAQRGGLVQPPVERLLALRDWARRCASLCSCAIARGPGPSCPTARNGRTAAGRAAAGPSASAGQLERHELGRLGGQGNLPRVLDGAGQRGFAIDVLAGLQRRQRDLFVLGCRRGNNDRLDVLVGENGLVVGGLGRRRRRAGGALQDAG